MAKVQFHHIRDGALRQHFEEDFDVFLYGVHGVELRLCFPLKLVGIRERVGSDGAVRREYLIIPELIESAQHPEYPRAPERTSADHVRIRVRNASHSEITCRVRDVAVCDDRDGKRLFHSGGDRVIRRARVHLLAEARMHGDGGSAPSLRRERAFDGKSLPLSDARAQLDGDGSPAALGDGADDVLDEVGMRHERAAVSV